MLYTTRWRDINTSMTNHAAIDESRSPPAMTPRRAWALALLADARAAAQETASDPWEFAVELSSLLAAGLTVNDVRWLSAMGYLRQAVETTQAKETVRTFVRSQNLSFPERTCFLATEAGLRSHALRRVVAGDLRADPTLSSF